MSPSASPSIPLANLEQEGFRCRNDDGDEATATWAADQDTAVTVRVNENIRIRFVINATGDVGSKQFKLQYKALAASEWSDVGLA